MIGYIIEKLKKIFIQHAIGCYDDNDIVWKVILYMD